MKIDEVYPRQHSQAALRKLLKLARAPATKANREALEYELRIAGEGPTTGAYFAPVPRKVFEGVVDATKRLQTELKKAHRQWGRLRFYSWLDEYSHETGEKQIPLDEISAALNHIKGAAQLQASKPARKRGQPRKIGDSVVVRLALAALDRLCPERRLRETERDAFVELFFEMATGSHVSRGGLAWPLRQAKKLHVTPNKTRRLPHRSR